MIGKKIYYETLTGDVILVVPEKHHPDAVNTTKEQDFQMYNVLQARNPELVDVIQLEYGEMQGDFEKANSVKVDLETGELLFDFPVLEKSHSTAINELKQDNESLMQDNEDLKQSIAELTTIIALMQM